MDEVIFWKKRAALWKAEAKYLIHQRDNIAGAYKDMSDLYNQALNIVEALNSQLNIDRFNTAYHAMRKGRRRPRGRPVSRPKNTTHKGRRGRRSLNTAEQMEAVMVILNGTKKDKITWAKTYKLVAKEWAQREANIEGRRTGIRDHAKKLETRVKSIRETHMRAQRSRQNKD